MKGQPELTPQVATTIREYLALQKRERKLKWEKKRLQQQLAAHLDGHGSFVSWHTAVDDEDVVVRMEHRERGAWNEQLLKERLGNRYKAVLMPDTRKLRTHAEVVRTMLEPIIEDVGSPNRQAVRQAVQQGLVSRDEIEGTLESKIQVVTWVARDRSNWGKRDAEEPKWARAAST